HNIRLLVERSRRATSFGSEDAEWVQQHFDRFSTLASSSEQFRYALEAATDWRQQRDYRAAIARLWSGIEAVFGLKTELVFRVSLLIASLLEPRGERRMTRFASIRALYDQRSRAVHGSEIAQQELSDAMNGTYEVLRALLLDQIGRGRTYTK